MGPPLPDPIASKSREISRYLGLNEANSKSVMSSAFPRSANQIRLHCSTAAAELAAHFLVTLDAVTCAPWVLVEIP